MKKKIYLVVALSIIFVTASVATVFKAGESLESSFNKNSSSFNVDERDSSLLNTAHDTGGEMIDYLAYVWTDQPPRSEETLKHEIKNPQPTRGADDIPSAFTWTDFNGDWSTPAKDQGNCGSCWDFSALGAFEAAIDIASRDPNTNIDLSEQYVLSCLGAAGGCNGGWMSEALECIESTAPGQSGNGVNGCTIESCMIYQAKDYIPCSEKCDDWDFVNLSSDGKLWEIANWGYSSFTPTNPDDWLIMKNWLLDYGPLSLDIYASGGWSSFFNTHHSPNDVYTGTEQGTTNHGVVLYGWKDDASFTNGGYWILKNSWGTDFGYGGFFNLEYGRLRLGDRDCAWVQAVEWPIQEGEDPTEGPGGPGPVIDYVFADFYFRSLATGDIYLTTNEITEFIDKSTGPVVMHEWDVNNDGTIDSTAKNPKWTFTTPGTFEIKLRVWNEWGMNHTITRMVEVKNAWPPVVKASPSSYGGKSLEISFEGRLSYDPDGYITSYLWNFGDGTTSDKSNVKHTFAEKDKIYHVTLTVTDDDGISSTANCEIKIDYTVPPVTTATIGGLSSDQESWFNEKVSVDILAEDWTGVSKTYYRINSGDWKTYTDRFYIFDDGVNTLEFYSVDIWGNEEDIKSESVKIDTDLPVVSAEISGSQENGWYVTSPVVTITASDSLSGIEKIIYRVNNNLWVDYTGSFSLPDGNYQIMIYAFDKAGNSQEYSQNVKVDTLPPTTNLYFQGEGSGNKYYQTVEVTLIAADGGSGIENIHYKLDGGALKTYAEPFSINTPGSHTIQYYSTDELGNDENIQTTTLTIGAVNFEMELIKPVGGIYLFGTRLFNIDPPIIIGKMTMQVDVASYTSNPADVSKVEFQIDGTTKHTATSPPYEWPIDERILGQHTIKIIAHSGNGESITKTQAANFFIF